MSDDSFEKEQAFEWFLAGFSDSSEGWNGECSYRHCRKHTGALSESTIEELRPLFEQAWEERGDQQ